MSRADERRSDAVESRGRLRASASSPSPSTAMRLRSTRDTPALGLGGAFSAERSFTSAQAATGVSDDVAALLCDQNVSITFDTVWGQRTVNATLDPGDPRTLESAALRLNEALPRPATISASPPTALAGGGAGLRVVTGALAHGARRWRRVELGGDASRRHARPDRLPPATPTIRSARLRVAERAARGAAITETIPVRARRSPRRAPTTSRWFPGPRVRRRTSAAAPRSRPRAPLRRRRRLGLRARRSRRRLAQQRRSKARAMSRCSKYDSAGKLLFTRIARRDRQSASGFALAVSADGKVAVAGSVEGTLAGTTAKGGADFVRRHLRRQRHRTLDRPPRRDRQRRSARHLVRIGRQRHRRRQNRFRARRPSRRRRRGWLCARLLRLGQRALHRASSAPPAPTTRDRAAGSRRWRGRHRDLHRRR